MFIVKKQKEPTSSADSRFLSEVLLLILLYHTVFFESIIKCYFSVVSVISIQTIFYRFL